MGDASPHFSYFEFACKCGCGFDGINLLQVKCLEILRRKLNLGYGFYHGRERRIHVNSGCRCWPYNRLKKGSRTSLHPLGFAPDIWVDGLTPQQVSQVALTIPQFAKSGIIVYSTFVHLDVGRERKYHRGIETETKWRMAA